MIPIRRKPSKYIHIFWMIGLLLLLSACSPLAGTGQGGFSQSNLVLDRDHTLGQTFFATQAGLQELRIFLIPDAAPNGNIVLKLFSNSLDGQLLAETSMSANSLQEPGWYKFDFADQNRSSQHTYYFQLSYTGSVQIGVGNSAGGSYLDGSAYQVDQPLEDAQLAFIPYYDRSEAVIGMLRQAAGWLGIAALGLLIFILPGWALLSFIWPAWSGLRWEEKTALAAGTGLAFYPLLMLWTDVVGLHLGAGYVWIPAGISAIMLLIRGYLWWKTRTKARFIFTWGKNGFRSRFPDIALLIVMGVMILVRFYSVRGLQVPMWGDAYQHTTMAQLIVDQGGLFTSWLPYTPYQSLTVQFGFPLFAALLAWAGRITVPQATLWVGQVLSCLAVFCLIPLANRMAGGNRWAGVGAVLVGGFLLPLPALYTDWGRYAQLGGQVILPVALWLLWDDLGNREIHIGRLIISAVALAGMILTYYRMPFYYATFVMALLLGWAIPLFRKDWKAWLGIMARMLIVAGIAFLFIIPWIPRVIGSNLASGLESGLTTNTPLDSIRSDYAAWAALTQYVPSIILIISVVALFWSLYRRQWLVAALTIWIAGLAAIKASQLINFPAANMMQSFAVIIALYIPLGLLIGWLFAQVADCVDRHGLAAGSGLLVVVLIVIGISIRTQIHIIQPETYALVNQPDLRAMQWIRENTPAEASFLVEGFRIYNGLSVVGSDAGWWIPLLAGRKNSIPPQYALLNESPIPKTYSKDVVDLEAALENNLSSSSAMARICAMGLTYVYIGQGQGLVGAGAQELFTRNELIANPNLEEVYHQDRVSIFAIKSQACQAAHK